MSISLDHATATAPQLILSNPAAISVPSNSSAFTTASASPIQPDLLDASLGYSRSVCDSHFGVRSIMNEPLPEEEPSSPLAATLGATSLASEEEEEENDDQTILNEGDAPTAAATTKKSDRWDVPRCEHNHFDNARVKKGMVELRCRDCSRKWRVKHPVVTLCPEFHATRGLCCLGSSCPYVHVHRYKSQDRSPSHPHYVGGPRDMILREAAIAVLEAKPRGTLPADVVGEIQTVALCARQVAVAKDSSRNASPKPEPTARARSPLSIGTNSMAGSPAPVSLDHRVSPGSVQLDGSSSMAQSPALLTFLDSDTIPLPAVFGEKLPIPQTSSSSSPLASSVSSARLLPITGHYVPTQRDLYKRSICHNDQDVDHGNSMETSV